MTKIYSDGKTSTLGKRFAALCVTTSILAVLNGVLIANLFSRLFSTNEVDDDEEGSEVKLDCPQGVGRITMDSYNRLICLLDEGRESLNLTKRLVHCFHHS